jgi:ankyrin repeat protein
LEATDGIGYTPLHTSASIRGKESCTKTLLQLGANPNPPLHSRSEEDCSPLHIASAEGNVEAVEALLQHGATILATNGVGDYPLTTAIQWGWHDPVSRGYPIISLLLSHHSSQELKKTEEKAKKEVESATTSLMKLEADTICYQRLLEVIQEEKRRRISKTIKTHSRTGPTTALEL